MYFTSFIRLVDFRARHVRSSAFWTLCFLAFAIQTTHAQIKTYRIDVSKNEAIHPVTLDKLGGKSPSGESLQVNNFYITKNGSPIIPVAGEFHYSRYPAQYWEESIKKMKAGGINMIATYIFWNIHEEKEGVFNWSGNRDLRKFISLCAKNNISVIVRIGPFDHGEIRNGGLPDWLLGKPLIVRSNDPLYLHYTELLYNEIGKQLKGLYYQDGGPIIGVQLENEYQHSAAPWGLTYPDQPRDNTVAERDLNSTHEGVSIASKDNPYAALGNDHMRALKTLAVKAGIIAPLYTATGWGYAAIIPDETLPVTAAYAYPTWEPKANLSPFYLFKDLHASPDYAPVRYQPLNYPAFSAELGSGIMATYSRRPLIPAESLDALINRCLGGGANGIGYYMYHGGSTPAGEHNFMSEEAAGAGKITYDFQAPIGEYGQVRPSFHRLKLIHDFVNDFGDELAPMTTVLPENAGSLKANNIDDLRYAARVNGNSGFLFLNNFQDNIVTKDHDNTRVSIRTRNGIINIPESGSFNLKAGENVILPFNFNLNGINLVYATAQLLLKGTDAAAPYYVFFSPAGITPEFCFDKTGVNLQALANCRLEQKAGKQWVKCTAEQGSLFQVKGNTGLKIRVLVISKAMALKSYLQDINNSRHLILTDALVLGGHQSADLLSVGQNNYGISIFPKITVTPQIDHGTINEVKTDKLFSSYSVSVPQVTMMPSIVKTGSRKINIGIPKNLPAGVDDIFLNIDYIGDTGMGFLNGDLVADDFYKGIPWQIGLKRFIEAKQYSDFGFYFRPLYKDSPFLADLPKPVAELASKSAETLQINSVTFIPEYKATIKF